MADITEAQIYEALGLQKPEGAQEQVPAEPAPQTSPAAQDTDAQEQEPAAPASGAANTVQSGTDTQEPGAVSANDADTGNDPGQDKQPLTEQQRRENAARRRQQEQQAAIDRAVENALNAEREKQNQQLQGFFAQAGLKNPTTGEPITTMEQFAEWQRQHDAAQLQKDLKAGKLTAEGLQKVMDTHPVIQKAQQLLDHQQAAQKAQQEAEDKARIDAELARISELDPSIKSVGDLLKMPTAEAFRGYVKKGYSFEDAFYLSNRERLEQQKVEAAKQQALNNSRGKDHLNPVGNSRSEGAVAVPAGVMAMYRRLNPTATAEQIQNHYNKYMKTKGGQ